jgi:hypothetical protein
VFQTKLPQLLRRYEGKANNLLVGFSKDFFSSGETMCPDIVESLQSFTDDLVHKRGLLRDNAIQVSENIKRTKNDAHALVWRQVKNSMIPGYEKGALQHGMYHSPTILSNSAF